MRIDVFFDAYVEGVRNARTLSTAETYKHRLNAVKKYLPVDDVEEITPKTVQEMVEGMRSHYSPKTIHASYDVLKAVMEQAKDTGIIIRNPCRGVKLPEIINHTPVLMSVEDLDQLCKLASMHPDLYLPILIATETGLRRSQIIALLWCDVNFNDSTLRVSKNVINSKSGVYTSGKERKTREIVISNDLLEILTTTRIRRKNAGIPAGDENQVCLTKLGKPMEARYFNNLFRKFVNENKGIDSNLRFHDIRWSFINNELAAGKNPKIVADKVGHSSAVFTLDYYCRYHDKLEQQKAA